MRKEPLENREIYHIFTRSISDFKVFNSTSDFVRMQQLIMYYNLDDNKTKFSDFVVSKIVKKQNFADGFKHISKCKNNLSQVISYALMPTHIHLILKQMRKNGITNHMKNILDGYSRYFNIKHKRKGPLWEGRFKSVLVRTDEQLLHLTRYIHLNPVSALIVDRPEDWIFSSYREYLSEENNMFALCRFDDILKINPIRYRKFVNDRIPYQRQSSKMKKILIDYD